MDWVFLDGRSPRRDPGRGLGRQLLGRGRCLVGRCRGARRVRDLLLVLTVLLTSCAGVPTQPDYWTPEGAVPFGPLAPYFTWWEEARECAQVRNPRRDFDDIDWYRVPGAAFETPESQLALGRWVPPRSIYLAQYSILEMWVVKHEMLHAMGFRHQATGTNYPWPFIGCAQ